MKYSTEIIQRVEEYTVCQEQRTKGRTDGDQVKIHYLSFISEEIMLQGLLWNGSRVVMPLQKVKHWLALRYFFQNQTLRKEGSYLKMSVRQKSSETGKKQRRSKTKRLCSRNNGAAMTSGCCWHHCEIMEAADTFLFPLCPSQQPGQLP